MTDAAAPSSTAECRGRHRTRGGGSKADRRAGAAVVGFQAAHARSRSTSRCRCSSSCCCSRSTGWRSPRSNPTTRCTTTQQFNPFWVHSPTLHNIEVLLFETNYPALADDHDGDRGRLHLPVGVLQRAGRLCDRAPALQGRAACRAGDLSGVSGAAVDPVHSAGHAGLPVRAVRQSGGADPDLPDVPGAVLHLAADRLFQVDPVRAGGMRADRRRVAVADPAADHAAAGGAGADLRGHLRLHAVVERVHLRAGVHPDRPTRRPCRWRS